tara:strand:+ start:141 stop:1109 length:969 start_codon:yes stop_codon:yes gene_type:complete
MKYLVTGAAGFIGFHIVKKLLDNNFSVVGIDNMNSYYDIELKKKRLKNLKSKNFKFYKIDLINKNSVRNLFKKENFSYVIHLAAQAGVRESLNNPLLYVDYNLKGFTNIIEESKNNNIKHFIFASSSSVYGANKNKPSLETDTCRQPISFYAATKIANESIAHSYSYNYGLPTTGLRFFTVYGPWGRPDMALFKFTNSIINNKEILVYNHGKMQRDFTYIDDVVDAIYKITNVIPIKSKKNICHSVYNVGSGNPIKLNHFIGLLEKKIGITAKKKFINMQTGDVKSTYASIDKISKKINYSPINDIEYGIGEFVRWYRAFYS